LIGRNVRVIDSLDCCHHFLLVEGVWHHLSLVAKTQYTTPPWCHGEAGVKLQSPSSSRPSNPLQYRRRSCAPTGWREHPWFILVRHHIRRTECSRLLSTARLVSYGEMLQYIAPLSHNNCTNCEKKLFWNNLTILSQRQPQSHVRG